MENQATQEHLRCADGTNRPASVVVARSRAGCEAEADSFGDGPYVLGPIDSFVLSPGDPKMTLNLNGRIFTTGTLLPTTTVPPTTAPPAGTETTTTTVAGA